MDRLKNKVAFITGAASGLGRAQAQLFAKEGASVIAADANGSAAAEVTAEITNFGGTASAQAIDVTDQQAVSQAVSEVIADYGRIDILSNTAGLFDHYAASLDTGMEQWDRIMSVNITGVFTVTNAVLPHMIAQEHGVVVNMASGAGLMGNGGGAAYTSSKHAVVGYTKQLDADYGSQGIRANAIAPGLIQTPMVASFTDSDATRATMAKLPAGRVGLPADIAHAALFLASDESDYIHSVVLPVDGGLTGNVFL